MPTIAIASDKSTPEIALKTIAIICFPEIRMSWQKITEINRHTNFIRSNVIYMSSG